MGARSNHLLMSQVMLGIVAFAIGLGIGRQHSIRDGSALRSPSALHLYIYESGSDEPHYDIHVQAGLLSAPLGTALSASKLECASGGCRVFDHFGVEIHDPRQLRDGQALWLIMPGRHFVFPTWKAGHQVDLHHVEGADPRKPVRLTTLAESPRLFLVDNFLDGNDADDLIVNALNITEKDYQLKRSTTGTAGGHISEQRTSENAFDTTSSTAMRLKQRAFELLGMRPYDERLADGLQVLRYNKSAAYIPHLDYMDSPPGSSHNFDPAAGGSNRKACGTLFATILLYLTDVEEGGETVFVEGHPLGEGRWLTTEEGVEAARRRGLTRDFRPGSWEEVMTGQCLARLAIQPEKAKAILFYSQHPTGSVDEKSLHGACPVLRGTKWAANLWVWNGPRVGTYEVPTDPIHALFTSSVPATLYHEETLWGDMDTTAEALSVNTFPGHRWLVKARGSNQVLHEWIIKEEYRPISPVQLAYSPN